jgi:hypothetical protein
MPQSTNLNKAPYFDDFDQDSNFYRVLFRPGYSIQSRELTTLQSILQNQVESLAKANFKQGSVVVPGEVIVDRQYSYVKVSSFTNNLQITDYIGKKMTGNSSGVVATVLSATAANTTDSATLFVKYEDGGTDNASVTFSEGETITANSAGSPTAIVGITGNVKPTNSNAMGYGSAVSVREGVYFINGTLVKNDDETVILDKYGNEPTYKVGFVVSEQLITPEEDFSLLDNAQGYSNFAAPGAHRLKMTVSLVKRPIDAPEQKDFVQLLSIKNGVSNATVELVSANGLIDDVLARRTFDESGDYVVKDFLLGFKEHLSSQSNNGVYTAAQGGSESKFVASLEPGKAYVKGYEIETTSTRYIDVDKARDSETQENNSVTPSEGSNYTVKNILSFPDVESKSAALTGTGLLSTNAFQELKFYDRFSDIAFGDTTANLDETAPEAENFWILTLESPSATTIPPVGTNWTNGAINGEIRYYVLNASNTEAVAIVTKPSSVGFSIGEPLSGGGVSATLKTAERISTPFVGIGKTKSFKFLSGTSTSGVYSKSALFKLGLFGVEYFTKISCKNPLNFSVGKFITGQTSNARGIVEQLLSDTNELILSGVIGEFAEGETLLSEQDGTTTPYNFVSQEGTISDFKAVSFGQNYDADPSGDVTAININGVNRLSDIGVSNITVLNNELRSITLTAEAREAIGTFTTAPVVEVVATNGYGCQVIANLNDSTVINYDSSFVKSFFNATTGNTFAGDIASEESTFYIDGGETFTASEGDYFITADNLGSRPDLDLVSGDNISIVDNTGVTRKYIVRFATPDGSTNTARIYVYGAVLSNFSAKKVARVRSKLSGVESNSLIYPLANKHVKTLVLDANNTNINYTVQKEFIGNFDAAGSASVSVGTNEQFLGYTSENYVLSNPDTGDLLDLSGAVTVGASSGSITIDLGATFANIPYKLIAPVRKVDTVPKTKVLVEDQEYNVGTGFGDPSIPLEYADGYKLKAVYMSATAADATRNDVEVTDRFTFDGGQRDTHYDLARLNLKPGEIVPTNKLLVVFDYFKHVGGVNTGDYFTVDSYTNINYTDIPSFESSVYGTVSLRDVVDFRPRVSDYTGLDTETVLPGYSDKVTVNSLKFTGNGSSASTLALPGTAFESGYEYYLNRIDSIYITKSGKFAVAKGTPSLNPQTPEELSDGILLYHINIPAYTYSLEDITSKSFDNRRYTMRDIGKLEKRIEKLEYYTVLSLLEQDTFNSQVKDEFGNDRFKNGILVDNFEGHGVGNTISTDYKCAIDTQTGVLRPSFISSQTKLRESNINDPQRTASGYSRKGDLATLPFTQQSTVSNPYATKTISINPDKSAKYSGIVTLTPNIDEWKDTYTTPELIVNENAVFDNIKNHNDNLWGSLWNEWQISWCGCPSYALNNSTNFVGASNQFASNPDLVISGKTRSRSRNGTQNRLSPYGSSTIDRGQKVLSVPYNPYIRSKQIEFVAEGLEPNTRLYAFFEGIDVSSWINPDDVTNITSPFTGIAGYAEKGFGESIITDNNGNVSGIFLVPNGYAPIKGKKTIDLTSTPGSFYDTGSTRRSFIVGNKSFRLTSSSSNSGNSENVSTFAEAAYTVSGLPETFATTIQSTRVPYLSRRSVSNSDTVQYAGSSLVNINQTGLLDPLAQTFKVSGFDEGMFMSSVDLYFANKSIPTGEDTDRPVTVYLTETNGGIPTRKVLPFSEVTMNSDTNLRIKISTDVPTGITLLAGETITGKTSGAIGTIKSNLTVTSANTRYNLILTNHNGIEFVAGEEFFVNRSPSITATTFNIDEDSGVVEKIRVTSFGSGYDDLTTTININGDTGGIFGTSATASPKIYNGKIFEIDVTNKGNGYYTAPTIIIGGGDGLASAEAVFKITNPAVRMGISTSADATIKTRFNFPSPVYLQNDATYAIVVTTSSKDYTLYSSLVGDQILNSVVVAANQPNVGSIYKSQNSAAWTEDTIEDLKFEVNRCVFSTSTTATIELVNDDLEYVELPSNPIFVDDTLGTSALFGSNQKILRVNHPNHGMKEGDVVILDNVIGAGSTNAIFGVPSTLINGLHSVSNVGIDDYCIQIDSTLWNTANVAMTGSGSGGGTAVRATTNKLYQVVSPQISILSFPSSTISQSIKTAFGKPVDSTVTNEYSLAPTVNITPNDNYFFEESRVIASPINEVYRAQSTLLNGGSSATYNISFQTEKDNVSPVLDVNRCNLITIGSRMDNPTGNEDRFGTVSQTLSVPTSSDYTVSTISPDVVSTTVITYTNPGGGDFTPTVDSASRLTQTNGASGQIVSVDLINSRLVLIDVVGDFIAANTISQGGVSATLSTITTKSGIVIGWDSGTGSLKVKMTTVDLFVAGDIIDDSNSGTSPVTQRTITASESSGGFLFVDEESFNGSAASKYLTKEVTLETPGTALDCKITANLFSNNNMKVMYKIRPDGSSENFDNISWEYFNGTGLSDNNSNIIPKSEKTLAPSVEDLNSYLEYAYTANNLKPFSSFAIKIVFVGSDPALAPRVEDLRVIAHS